MKQATRILSVLLALLMAFSVTAIAADVLTVVASYDDASLNGANVPAGSDIFLEFSNNVTDESVLASNLSKIKLLDASGENATASLSVGSQKSTIVVTLGSTLAKGSYTLTLGKDIQAKNGTTLGEKKEFKFNVKGSGTGTGGGDKKLEVKSVTVDGTKLEDANVRTASEIKIVFTNGMTNYANENKRLITIVKSDGESPVYSVNTPDLNSADDDAKRTFTVLLGFIDPGDYKLVLGADLKANNGNTLGKDVEYTFTVKDEADQPAAPTFLQRVQTFFADLGAKAGAFFRMIAAWFAKLFAVRPQEILPV